MSKIRREDLNTIKAAVKHIIEKRQQRELPGVICRGCPVSSFNNGFGISCRDFIDTIDKDVRMKAGCGEARGCEYRLTTMKYILKNYNNRGGCKI
jgi:hypothetical protein